MKYGKILALVFVALLAACQASQPTNNEASREAQRPVQSSPSENLMESKASQEVISATSATHTLQGALKKGMAYADFRNVVLASGWTSMVDSECKANVVGGNYETLCAENPGLAACQVCDRMPELSACSGDGHCLVRFQHAGDGEIMEATGYGMIEDWNVLGEESRLQVSEWSFSRAPMH